MNEMSEEWVRRMMLFDKLHAQGIEDAYQNPQVQAALEVEASKTDEACALITPHILEQLRVLIAEKARIKAICEGKQRVGSISLQRKNVVLIIPGFMASSLSDVAPNGSGLLWISLYLMTHSMLGALELGAYDGTEHDLDPRVYLSPTGPLPILYDLLRLTLEIEGYTVEFLGVDWRKDMDLTAAQCATRLRILSAQQCVVHLVAHSQGALIARKAIQILGATDACDVVKNMILVGPANYGTFSAALALGSGHMFLRWAHLLLVEPLRGFQRVLSSMTALYQLLPWDATRLSWSDVRCLGSASFWQTELDSVRLRKFFGWGSSISTDFFNDRTVVILSDDGGRSTVGGVEFRSSVLHNIAAFGLPGDGTVPHACSVLPGVSTYVVPGSEHSTMCINEDIIKLVVDIITARDIQLLRRSSDPADYLSPPCTDEGDGEHLSSSAIISGEAVTLRDVVVTSQERSVIHQVESDLGQELRQDQVGSIPPHNVTYEVILDACDLLPFSFLRTGDRLGRAVVKIQCQDGAVGTGFLISPGILLTNQHVLPDVEAAQSAYAVANYEVSPPTDAAGRSAVAVLKPELLFVANAELDFCFCGITGLDFLGTVPVERNSLATSVMDYVNIIQHPRGRPKEVALQDNQVVKADKVVVQYACDTEPGSSGSPVFDNQWRLVALHHASVMSNNSEGRRAMNLDPSARYLNEGIRMSAIATWLELAEPCTDKEREQFMRLRAVFQGMDPQIGFFGALGKKPGAELGIQTIIECYEHALGTVDIGFWDLGWVRHGFHGQLVNVGRVVVEMGLNVWCLLHAAPVVLRALCEHLETNYQLSYEYICDHEDHKDAVGLIHRCSPGLEVHRWPMGSVDTEQPVFEMTVPLQDKGQGTCRIGILLIPGNQVLGNRQPDVGNRVASELVSLNSGTDWIVCGHGCLEAMVQVASHSHGWFRTVEGDIALGVVCAHDSWVESMYLSPNIDVVSSVEQQVRVVSDRKLPASVMDLAGPHPIAVRLCLRDPMNRLGVEREATQVQADEPNVDVTSVDGLKKEGRDLYPLKSDDALEQRVIAALRPVIMQLVADMREQTSSE